MQAKVANASTINILLSAIAFLLQILAAIAVKDIRLCALKVAYNIPKPQ